MDIDMDDLGRELYEKFYGRKPEWTGIKFYDEWVNLARYVLKEKVRARIEECSGAECAPKEAIRNRKSSLLDILAKLEKELKG